MKNGAASEAANSKPQVRMKILRQFVRDLSFENVVGVESPANPSQPNISVQVGLDAQKTSAENQYSVSVKLNIKSTAKEGDDNLFLMELDYVGLFEIEGVDEPRMHPFLLIECPRLLFPFVRRIVSDVTHDGGFPSLNLENIDFAKIYSDEVQRRRAAADDQPASSAEDTNN
ncbi:MAG: protein-export chaperone SecB [Aestuariivita sp.]|nr:protein-export chaperone SecB [Aestuariivita sp.]MCY4347359.1 protein-export chaperone SecB [Aestuariivita sp.]